MPLIATNPKPRVILGLMTFGPDESEGARVTSLDDFNECLDYMQSQGYNEIDTARIYVGGKQEAFTAAANWKDRGLKLATKVYPTAPYSHEPSVLKAALDTSLTELKTDCVDIFYLHAADRGINFETTLEAVNEMHKAGKFVQLGLSNFTAFEVAEVVMICRERGWVRPTIYQAMYNAISVSPVVQPQHELSHPRAIEAELVVACRRYGLEIVVYNPTAGGFFAGKYKVDGNPDSGRFSSTTQMGRQYRSRYFRDSYFEAMKIIEPVVQKHNLTLLETAFRWMVHHSQLKMTPESGGRDGLIMGVSSLAQIKSNLADIEKGPLPEEVVQALDAAWSICKGSAPNYWHLDLEYTYDTQEALFGKK